MTPFYTDDSVTLYHGDCLEVLASLPDCSVDSVVTDPPYGLGFMGREWDDLPPGVEFAAECLRVLKPGGHMLAFGGSRTWHRLACAVEDAGFEIRDSIAWLYGSGFPKSLDVSKAIDKAAGVERTEVVGKGWHASTRGAEGVTMGRFAEEYEPDTAGLTRDILGPATPDAQKWQGWGTALKPAFEPIVVARKPLAGTVSQNVLAYGTGALNIAACRVTASDQSPDSSISHDSDGSSRADNTACTCPSHEGDQTSHTLSKPRQGTSDDVHARHSDPPANAQPSGNGHRPLPDSLDGYQSLPRSGDEPAHVSTEDAQASALPPPGAGTSPARCATCGGNRSYPSKPYPDSTAPNVETRAGRWPSNVVLDDSQATELDRQSGTVKGAASNGRRAGNGAMFDVGEQTQEPGYGDFGGASRFFPTFKYEPKAPTTERPRENGTAHPTVKPLDLIRWLVRLVTPHGGIVLEPFAGSGTTAEACVVEGFKCVAVEREADYLPLIVQRLTKPIQVTLI